MSVFSRANILDTLSVSSSTNNQISITDNAAGSAGDYRNALVSLKPSMGASENYIHSIGNNTNPNNAGYVGFRYAGDGSLDNNMTIGLYDNNHLLNVYKTKVTIPMTTQSDSTTSGALTVSGGVSIAKNLYVGGTINGTFNITTVPSLTITNTTDATNTASGALAVNGGVGIAKSLYVGSGINIGSTGSTVAFAVTNGNLEINASGGDVNIASDDVFHVLNTKDSLSYDTGALVVHGGVGIAKSLIVSGDTLFNDNVFTNFQVTAGNIIVSTTTESTNTATGALKVAGGLGVAKNIFLGGYLGLPTSTVSFSFTGPVSVSVDVLFTKLTNELVRMTIKGVYQNATADGQNYFDSSTLITAALRPAVSTSFPIVVNKLGGTPSAYVNYMRIFSDGYIRIYRPDWISSSIGTSVGWEHTTIVYSLV